MNHLTVFVGCLLFAMVGPVSAACTANTRIQPGADINTLLSGKTVCGTGVNDSAGDQWQEWHQSGGTLTEYAKGSSAVDPTHDVGIWSTSGNGANSTVDYNYNGGSNFSFNVHDNGGGSYSFCSGGAEVATATLISGQASCGF